MQLKKQDRKSKKQNSKIGLSSGVNEADMFTLFDNRWQ